MKELTLEQIIDTLSENPNEYISKEDTLRLLKLARFKELQPLPKPDFKQWILDFCYDVTEENDSIVLDSVVSSVTVKALLDRVWKDYVQQPNTLEDKTGKEELLKNALLSIQSIGEDEGREGCRYGDTEYDSLSVVHGFNMCLEWCKQIATEAIQKYSSSSPVSK